MKKRRTSRGEKKAGGSSAGMEGRLGALIKDTRNDLGVLIEGVREEAKTDTRHLGVLIETVRDEVRTVAEQHGSIIERLDSHDKKLDSHTEMIGRILVDVNEIKNGLKQKVDFSDFAKLEKRVTIIERRLVH